MKLITLALLASLSVAAFALQEAQTPAPTAKHEQHAWLDHLVGEWDVATEATMSPGADPVRFESTESVRSIGGLWVLAEGSIDMGGEAMTTLMTLGYDPRRGHFVGTWVDSMQAHMWNYVGTLDAGRTTLTLEAEGPAFADPTKLALFRDVITLQGKDKKVLRASVQGADGQWTQFMTAVYTRRK